MSEIAQTERLAEELHSFQELWEGGYYEGNPLDPMSYSAYGVLGYMSILHVVYLTCIKPYLTSQSKVIEIGPGRGGWTKALLPAQEVWCLDALSAEHNHFWEYIGRAPHVKYLQVSDFSCSQLPDNSFDFLFSFGTFCHISFEGITEYMTNLRPKLKRGAHGFVMIADYQKYNEALDHLDHLNIATVALNTFARRKIYQILKWPVSIALKWASHQGLKKLPRPDIHEDLVPRPTRWYHAGIERTCQMLQALGYEIIDADVGAVHRDPIVHFVR